MTRLVLACACAIGALLPGSVAHAQQVVHDPRSYAQMLVEARTALDQLRALEAEVAQGRELLDSLNDASDVNGIARELGLPGVRSPLPDLARLRAAADGDLSALGDLADRALEIRRGTRAWTPDPATGVDAFHADSLERSGARTARDLAIGEALGVASDRRRGGLEQLRGALDTATSARAVLDLEARLSAEQALIQNEQVRLQGLALTQAAEARLEEQRARERAEAARTERMRRYARSFR